MPSWLPPRLWPWIGPGSLTDPSSIGISMNEETADPGSFDPYRVLNEIVGRLSRLETEHDILCSSSRGNSMESKSPGSESQSQSSSVSPPLESWMRFFKWLWPTGSNPYRLFSSLTPMQQQRLVSFIESFGDGESEASTPPPSSPKDTTPTPAQRMISEESWEKAREELLCLNRTLIYNYSLHAGSLSNALDFLGMRE